MLIAVGAIVVATQNDDGSDDPIAAVLEADDVTTRTLEGSLGTTLDVAYSADEGAMVITGDDVPAVAEDETYQVWLVDEGGALPSRDVPSRRCGSRGRAGRCRSVGVRGGCHGRAVRRKRATDVADPRLRLTSSGGRRLVGDPVGNGGGFSSMTLFTRSVAASAMSPTPAPTVPTTAAGRDVVVDMTRLAPDASFAR